MLLVCPRIPQNSNPDRVLERVECDAFEALDLTRVTNCNAIITLKQQCLEGRRVIFLGDSLSNQQGDSLVGMLGWHPDWLPLGGPRNDKQVK